MSAPTFTGKQICEGLFVPDGSQLADGSCEIGPEHYANGLISIEEARKVRDMVNQFSRKVPPFADEKLFLSELHFALFHFKSMVQRLFYDDSNLPKVQRDYYKKLSNQAGKMISLLEEANEVHQTQLFERLLGNYLECIKDLRELDSRDCVALKENFDVNGGFSEEKCRPPEDLSVYVELLQNLQYASDSAASDLFHKKSSPRSDLHHLIEMLAGVFRKCSGRQPSLSVNGASKSLYGGDFFRFVQEVVSVVDLKNSSSITDNAIADGIKLLKK